MSSMPNGLVALAQDARLRLEKLRLPEPAIKVCTAALARMEQVLARPPRVALMGEVNSGKTSTADLLLGAGVLPASVVINTHVPVLVRHADGLSLDAVTQKGRHRLTENALDELPSGLQLKRIEIGLPNERLTDFEILDTPGDYVPGGGMPDAQIFVWCTVATRAWTESERQHWSALPQRCRRYGLLLATHKDALSGADEVVRVEQRLRGAAAGMFRDVMLVTAVGAGRSGLPFLDAQPTDESADALWQRLSAWATEVSAQRARKAERIVRHLARLTFHRLAPGPLSFEAEQILKGWQRDCARLIASVDGTTAGTSRVIEALLMRFARAMSETRTGRAVRGAPLRLVGGNPPANGPYRVPAARRYVSLICADLTALLRSNLVPWGLRDVARRADYAAARAILLPLADLDATFDEVGQRLAAGNAAGAKAEAGTDLSAMRRS